MSVLSCFRNTQTDAVVRDYIRRNIPRPDTFVKQIDENDEMYLFSLQLSQGDRRRTQIEYYMIGSMIYDAIKQIAAWHAGSVGQIGRFLDFGCGYGRSTRFLIQELSPRRVWAVDIYPEAVEFQRRRYGVNGIVSVPDPEDFPTDIKFDFIFASSFFSHMPESTFGRWLEKLFGLLTPGGILVFSTHGMSLAPPGEQGRRQGIWFIANSESRTIDKNQYGTTYVDEEYVAGVVARVSGGTARLHYIEKGMCSFQDLYIVANDRDRDFSDLAYVHFPSGGLDTCNRTANREIELSGWAADHNHRRAIAEVQILSNGTVVQTFRPRHDRADIAERFGDPAALRSGWSCRLNGRHVRADKIIEVKVVNEGRRSITLFHNYVRQWAPGLVPGRGWAARTLRSIAKRTLPRRVCWALAILKNGVPPARIPAVAAQAPSSGGEA
jgi:SAM-dependent methyltransferase